MTEEWAVTSAAAVFVWTVALLALVSAVGYHLVTAVISRRLMVRRQVLVQLHSGAAFTGVLWRRTGRLIVLRGAQYLEPQNQPHDMDGDVVLDRDNIEFVQAR
jgi:uncharacterized membrane protein YraQ (UPF0718 family)